MRTGKKEEEKEEKEMILNGNGGRGERGISSGEDYSYE